MSDFDAEGVDKLFGAFSCQTLTSLYCANAIRNLLELEIIAYNFLVVADWIFCTLYHYVPNSKPMEKICALELLCKMYVQD